DEAGKAFYFGGCGVSVDNRLHDSFRAENCRRTERQDMRRAATFDLIGFIRSSAAGFELIDVVLNDTLRDRDYAGYVRCGCAAVRLDVTNVRCGVRFWSQTKKENIDAARRFQGRNVTDHFRFEVRRVGLHRIESLHLSEERL